MTEDKKKTVELLISELKTSLATIQDKSIKERISKTLSVLSGLDNRNFSRVEDDGKIQSFIYIYNIT